MKYCFIIAEFNPFTNGHNYIINEAQKQTGLDVICLMSGNVVQRGEMAILDKYTRSRHAINAGASAVFELPAVYACSSADDFGEGAVKCIEELNCCSHLAFGVETDDIDFLETLAKFKATEPKEFKNLVKANMKKGESYSVATFNAYMEYFPNKQEQIKDFFNSPNNILALTYVTSLYKFNSKIIPVYIKRQDNGYNASKVAVKNGKKFAGASHIRNLIYSGKIKDIKNLVPSFVFDDLEKINTQTFKDRKMISEALFMSALREQSIQELYTFHDYREGLSPLIYNAVNKTGTLSEVVEACTSKAYRESRIRKLVMYPYLNISSNLVVYAKNNLSVVNALAVKNDKKYILHDIKKTSKNTVVVSAVDYNKLKAEQKELLKANQKGTNLYNLACSLPRTRDLTEFV